MVNNIKLIALYNKELSVVDEYSAAGFASTSGTALLDAGEINVGGKM